jgi:hypothetical protein|tara:strand:+ start:213 stop:539 length:327 start_codon:yes stop_codon:yes gene_type:complete
MADKKKKIVFYDSDKRHVELKIRLKHDGLSQAQFFRDVVTGYINKEKNILNFIDKIKLTKRNGSQDKSSVKESRKLIKDGNELMKGLSLDDSEIENIFDMIEKENPDL